MLKHFNSSFFLHFYLLLSVASFVRFIRFNSFKKWMSYCQPVPLFKMYVAFSNFHENWQRCSWLYESVKSTKWENLPKRYSFFMQIQFVFVKRRRKKRVSPNIRKILTVDYFVAKATANCMRCILWSITGCRLVDEKIFVKGAFSFGCTEEEKAKKNRQKTYLLDLDLVLNSWKNVNADSFHQSNGANIHDKHIKYIFQLNHANKTEYFVSTEFIV